MHAKVCIIFSFDLSAQELGYLQAPSLVSITTMNAAALIFTPPFPLMKPSAPHQVSIPKPSIVRCLTLTRPIASRPDFRVWSNDGDDVEVSQDYDDIDDEVEEVDNKKDFDLDYDTAVAGHGEGDDIAMVDSESFVYTQDLEAEKIVDYRINEDEFHKICLLDCDFFIRKPPDPDSDVYDFREMYVTPPDTDAYAIPKVLAPMPQKYIRCGQSDYGCYNVTEPPVDALRDPLYKSEREVLKIFLIKHYRNRRADDPEFALDFEEIYVIDSKAKSITRAKVVVTVPEGRERDKRRDLLVVRDKGNSFKIIPMDQRDDPTTVIQELEWNETREEMEKHLRKLRDFSISNWF